MKNYFFRKYGIWLYILSMILTFGIFLTIIAQGLTAGSSDSREASAEPYESVKDTKTKNLYDSDVSINHDTLIVYEYYYLEDGHIEKTEEDPPHFLLDKTRDYFEELLVDWELLEFDQDRVVLRKYMDGKSSQYYILSEYEGFVAVFYEEEINGSCLKEITDKPIKSLASEDQERLKKGIRITGDDALYKALEDYGS